jgi:hypothetical protein
MDNLSIQCTEWKERERRFEECSVDEQNNKISLVAAFVLLQFKLEP